MQRREFLTKLIVLPTGLAIVALISDCGGDGSSSESAASGTGAGLTGAISANHRHTVFLTDVDLAEGAEIILALTLGDGHTHQVTLLASHLTTLLGGSSVSKGSSQDAGHTHTVTFTPLGPCTATNITMDIHLHSVVQPDLLGGMEVTLAMTGQGHTHNLSLTATDLIMLS
ncbi:MAG: hypothetical protein O7A08_14790, partial [SAR324 cluster bacterium]|nr:hypothetical protein [SAR324 cluster bacterium]